MGEAMIFVVDSDEAVGQCDDEDMRKLEALAANESDEQVSTCRQTDLDLELKKTEEKSDSNDEGFEGIAQIRIFPHDVAYVQNIGQKAKNTYRCSKFSLHKNFKLSLEQNVTEQT